MNEPIVQKVPPSNEEIMEELRLLSQQMNQQRTMQMPVLKPKMEINWGSVARKSSFVFLRMISISLLVLAGGFLNSNYWGSIGMILFVFPIFATMSFMSAKYKIVPFWMKRWL